MKHCGTKKMETERLILRRFEKRDAEAMYRNWMSDDDVTEYMTWKTHKHVESSQEMIEKWLDSYDRDDFYYWAIVPKDGKDEPIGVTCVVGIQEDVEMMEVGYCIGQNWWHQGIASEAYAAVILYLFHEVKVNRIESRHDVGNPRSGRVMLKCGLKYEGTLRQMIWNNHGLGDEAVYSILAEDFFEK